ncbi:MAG: hypothetical protein AABZ12_04600 [Planctomycetota bacterium]
MHAPAPMRRFTGMVWCAVLVAGFVSACRAPNQAPQLVYFPPPPATPRVVHLKSFNDLRELVPQSAPSWTSWTRGSTRTFVGTPAGLAYHADTLYVCDTQLNVVHAWNVGTGTARQFGADGETLSKPVAVAVGDDDRIFVADTDRREIAVFDGDGRHAAHWRPRAAEEFRPIALFTRDDRLHVCDAANDEVCVLSTTDGSVIRRFGGTGSELGAFHAPAGVAVGHDGTVFVSDMLNSRVQALTGEGRPLFQIGKPGNRFGCMGKPRQVGLTPGGILFIADAEFAHVQVYDTSGELLMMFGGPDGAPGSTPMPVGIAVATELPPTLTRLVPSGFQPTCFVFVSNTIGAYRLSLFAVNTGP